MKKCSNCPFAVNMGTYEDPEMACEFFGYSVPDEFDSEDHEGCNLNFSEAKKLESLQVGEWEFTPEYHFKQMVDKDYKPTEEDLAEEKELQEKGRKKEELYNEYFEELKARRKKEENTCKKGLHMENIADLVKSILEKYPRSRDDDYNFLYCFIVIYTKFKGIEVHRNTLDEFYFLHQSYGLPPVETILRAKRRIQSKHPELKGEEDGRQER